MVIFFDEDASATIQDAVESLTANFAGLEIKKSIAEFMSEEWNLSIKVVSRHPLGRNKEGTLQARAYWVDRWVNNDNMNYLKNCIFVDESGFDINMRRSRGWSKRGTQAVVTTPSARGVSHTVIGAISAIGVVNLSMRESGNAKRKKVVSRSYEEKGASG